MSSQGAGQPAESTSGKYLTARVCVLQLKTQMRKITLQPHFSINNSGVMVPPSQNIKVELESVQEDLTNTRKDKFMLQVKVSELRNSMKTVLLQNQQLKLDLKQNRLRKARNLYFFFV